MSDDEPFFHLSPLEEAAVQGNLRMFPARFWRHYCMWRMHFTRWNALQAAWRTAR